MVKAARHICACYIYNELRCEQKCIHKVEVIIAKKLQKEYCSVQFGNWYGIISIIFIVIFHFFFQFLVRRSSQFQLLNYDLV